MPKILAYARTNLIKADIGASFSALAELMLNNNIGSIVITENEEIVGYMDDKTILSLISEKKNPNDHNIKEFIQKFQMIHQDTNILYAWEKIRDFPDERFGIINDEGKIVGIIRKRTINRFRHLIMKEEMNIKDDFMS